MPIRSMPDLLTVADALRLIEQHATVLPAEPVALTEALGRTLAADVASDVDSPPHNKAMMDGYAVRSGDGMAPRAVVEEVFAGGLPTAEVGPGQATRIMTGAPMPAGADCVTPVEQTELAGGSVSLTGKPPQAGKHVMPRGEAMRAGQTVLRAGAVVRPAEVALLAEVGAARVQAIRRPRVAVLPTGAELVPPSEKPGPGQIRNSNGPMLLAAVREASCQPIDAGVGPDDERGLRQAVQAARGPSPAGEEDSGADVLLLSGGVSAGDRDLAPGVLAELGVQRVLHKVAVKPGKPVWFGVWPPDAARGTPTWVFGLPGNPVSSFVCFHLFVRPLLSAIAGRGFAGLPMIRAALVKEHTHRGGRETYLPARVTTDAAGKPAGPAGGAKPGGPGGTPVETPAERPVERLVEPVAWRGSADLAGLVAANALIRLPVEPGHYPPGTQADVLLLPTA
ncbi:MAG: gephyrin-like molybdotransferase Glp [Planctomycetota bacterium]